MPSVKCVVKLFSVAQRGPQGLCGKHVCHLRDHRHPRGGAVAGVGGAGLGTLGPRAGPGEEAPLLS